MTESFKKYLKIPTVCSIFIEERKDFINLCETPFINNFQTFKLESFSDLLFTTCRFNQEFYQSSLFLTFGVSYHQTLLGSVEKRQAEFLAGRVCAKLALENKGSTSSEVKIGEHRCPIWPEGFSGSITHSNNIAMSAVATNQHSTAVVGIDLESWLTTEIAANIKNIIIGNEEEEIAKECNLPFEDFLTLAFSSKEALFKALYPKVGYYFDFHSAQITYVNVQAGIFELKITKTLSTNLINGAIFHGVFCQYNEHILTVIHYTAI